MLHGDTLKVSRIDWELFNSVEIRVSLYDYSSR